MFPHSNLRPVCRPCFSAHFVDVRKRSFVRQVRHLERETSVASNAVRSVHECPLRDLKVEGIPAARYVPLCEAAGGVQATAGSLQEADGGEEVAVSPKKADERPSTKKRTPKSAKQAGVQKKQSRASSKATGKQAASTVRPPPQPAAPPVVATRYGTSDDQLQATKALKSLRQTIAHFRALHFAAPRSQAAEIAVQVNGMIAEYTKLKEHLAAAVHARRANRRRLQRPKDGDVDLKPVDEGEAK